MTSRERLLTVMRGEMPDCVPASPDTSNMIPARMTGLPFWDIYLYQKIPQWKAYIDCVKYFGYDAFMDGFVPVLFEELGEIDRDVKEAIVLRDEDRIVSRRYRKANGKLFWDEKANVYFRSNPPVRDVDPVKAGADFIPNHYETVEKTGPYAGIEGEELLRIAKDELGEHGVLGVWCGRTTFVTNEEQVYAYYDDPDAFEEASREYLKRMEKRFTRLMQMKTRPDFICTGGSGTLVFQTVEMFRRLGLPVMKRIAELCHEHGIPSHVHSCGPEKELVKICHDETCLTVIDPLEIPPMGNCGLTDYAADSELYVGSGTRSVYAFESNDSAKLQKNYSNGQSYAMTMKNIKSAEFYNASISVKAFVQLKNGTYVYSDVKKFTVYNLAHYLYQNRMMNNAAGHIYLYKNILTVTNPNYKEVDFDWSKTLVS